MERKFRLEPRDLKLTQSLAQIGHSMQSVEIQTDGARARGITIVFSINGGLEVRLLSNPMLRSLSEERFQILLGSWKA